MIDFFKYIYNHPEKTDQVNEADTLTFDLVPWDNGFVRLQRGDYIVINTQAFGTWFSGYVTNDPELEYFGTLSNTPVWGYKYQATGDAYILSLQLLGTRPPFLNTTQGAILKALINDLLPNVFDVTGIQDGVAVAEYEVDPETRFADVLKDFADSSYFNFTCQNHIAIYAPIADAPAQLVIDGASKHFTPSKLKIKQSNDAIINDAIVVGDVEPQTYVNEYFVGDGFTGKFPLISSVYGLAQNILIDDDFSSDTIDTSKWILEDGTGSSLVESNSFLNCTGGDGAYGVYLVAGAGSSNSGSLNNNGAQVIPLEAHLRMTHGEFDFIPNPNQEGLIGSLWTALPSSNLTDCIFGIKVEGTNLYPFIDGVVDRSQTQIINNNYHYVIRTIADFSHAQRLSSEWGFIDEFGNRSTFGGAQLLYPQANVRYQTIIVAIDPNTGFIVQPSPGVNYTSFLNSALIDPAINAAFYAPAVLVDLQLALTGVTVSYPLQASLEILSRDLWLYPNLPSWGNNGPIMSMVNYQRADTIATIQTVTPPVTVPYTVGQWIIMVHPEDETFSGVWFITNVIASDTFQCQTVFGNVDSTPALDGQVQIISGDIGGEGLIVNSVSRFAGITTFEFTATPLTPFFIGETLMVSILDDRSFCGVFPVYQIINSTTVQVLQPHSPDVQTKSIVASLAGKLNPLVGVNTGWRPLLVGPNEIDSQDGLSPAATITDSGGGRTISQHGIRHLLFNPGQANLEFFKDSTTQTSSIAATGDIIHLRYRHAGVAVGRVQNSPSIASEATRWGDGGTRQTLKKDVSPLPRNSQECEMAAAALVSDWGYQHYEGSYETTNLYGTIGEPKSGTILFFQNLPNVFLPVTQELIHSVKTVFDHIDLATGAEIFTHTITFSRPDRLQKTLSKFSIPKGSFHPDDSSLQPDALDLTTVSNGFADDVATPLLSSWTETTTTFDINQAPPAGGEFEVRYTDAGFSQIVDGGNLVIRQPDEVFTVARSNRGRSCYIKANDSTGLLFSRFSALMHTAFPFKPQPPTGQLDNTDPTQIVVHIQLPLVAADIWGIEIRDSDQVTVVYHSDLVDPTLVMDWLITKAVTSSPPDLWLYSYNLLGEYGEGFHVLSSNFLPQLVPDSLHIDVNGKQLVWVADKTAAGASGYLVEVDASDNTFHNIVLTGTTGDQSFPIPDPSFFPDRFYRVTPYNAVGKGAPEVLEFMYIPDPVIEFLKNHEFTDVKATAGGALPPVPSSIVGAGFVGEYYFHSYLLERIARGSQ